MSAVVHSQEQKHTGPLRNAGLALGVGLGGFLDGIVLHQILQWHNMLSARLPPTSMENMRVNMLWDGVFHAGMWGAVALGVWLLWRAGQRADALWSGRLLLGAMMAGWGGFNVVEGLVDHQLLGLHHVRDMAANVLAWDLGFLLVSLGLIALGWALMRGTRSTT